MRVVGEGNDEDEEVLEREGLRRERKEEELMIRLAGGV